MSFFEVTVNESFAPKRASRLKPPVGERRSNRRRWPSPFLVIFQSCSHVVYGKILNMIILCDIMWWLECMYLIVSIHIWHILTCGFVEFIFIVTWVRNEPPVLTEQKRWKRFRPRCHRVDEGAEEWNHYDLMGVPDVVGQLTWKRTSFRLMSKCMFRMGKLEYIYTFW